MISNNPLATPSHHQYSTYADDVTLDVTELDLHLSGLLNERSSWEDYGYSTNHRMRERREYTFDLNCIFRPSDSNPTPDDECLGQYIRELLETAVFNREITPAEFEEHRAFARGVLAQETDPTSERRDSLRQIVNAAWLSTEAIFRSELGHGTADESGRRPLDIWELAKSLAYTFEDRAAGTIGAFLDRRNSDNSLARDENGVPIYSAAYGGHMADIRAAAEDGSLYETAVLQGLVQTHLAGIDPERHDLSMDYRTVRLRARAAYWLSQKTRRFFREWLGYEKAWDIFKDTPLATSKYADGEWHLKRHLTTAYGLMQKRKGGSSFFEPNFVWQLDDTIARIVVENRDVPNRGAK